MKPTTINTYTIKDIYTTQDNEDESEDLSLFIIKIRGDFIGI